MKKTVFLSALALAGAALAVVKPERLQVTAGYLAGDRASESFVASGGVHAVALPYQIEAESMHKLGRDVAGFPDSTRFTTCTNLCCRHWQLSGELEYHEGEYAVVRNAWLEFFELPVMWVPYWYYPLDDVHGLRVMPGYTSRWGAYLLTKYNYHIAGNRDYNDNGPWLHGNTRVDLRYENGLALGESLYWGLGRFGLGHFKIYYAWDADHTRYSDHWHDASEWNYSNWGSEVPANRYGIELAHRLELTERDTLRLNGQLESDSYFRYDFMRRSAFGMQNRFTGYVGNELSHEHVENAWSTALSVSGPLNKFYSGVSRLPEFLLDIAPQPVWTLPVNYESHTSLGYYHRQYSEYGDNYTEALYRYQPGEWANYQTFRMDTYHRLTAPFKVAEVLAVVPRLGLRGTYWNESGYTVLGGDGKAGKAGEPLFRTIFESGVTFAARGTGWLTERTRHVLEPYFDVLAQEAWYSGLSGRNRPYVFDSADGSYGWEDQFAGRSRNLPYSYYGVTPGVRNVLQRPEENGTLRTVLDFDLYAALQFKSTEWLGNGYERLAEPGKPNYGERDALVVPGWRLRWFPWREAALASRFEYDAENNKVALASILWSQRLGRELSWHAQLTSRDHRLWDYSTTPDGKYVSAEDFNHMHFAIFEVGCEHELCDAVAWGPYLRWDCRDGKLDEVGTWLDLRTDCLGFRFSLSYENEYTRIDGSTENDDWRVGFYVYLRAFGPNNGSPLGDD